MSPTRDQHSSVDCGCGVDGTLKRRGMTMLHREIERLACLTEAAWGEELAALERSEAEAYSRYCHAGIMPAAVAGTPQAAGLGSVVCDLSPYGEQGAWLAAKRAAEEHRLARESWALDGVDGGVATYTMRQAIVPDDYAGCLVRAALEIVTHGVDVSGCPTPAAAIHRVRAARQAK